MLRAIRDIGAVPGIEVDNISPLARTAPVGLTGQPDFFNAVILVQTRLSARQLLRVLQMVEQLHGRMRTSRWGPRCLDLDLISYGSLVAQDGQLTLPHSRAWQRAFVLVPWAQISPEAVLPGPRGGAVARLAEVAPDLGGVRWLSPNWKVPKDDPIDELESAGPHLEGDNPIGVPAADQPPAASPVGDGSQDGVQAKDDLYADESQAPQLTSLDLTGQSVAGA